ncbi:MAG TPA: prepilin-type N-terminal cleavage/methylation domain-containing protein [Candidatus Sulfotelmatobacter sp.]|nr:prepilin-type N-terminal cleavage/methylation domain-containing protein [Candidatus Sulfotelmatobacter sp.]
MNHDDRSIRPTDRSQSGLTLIELMVTVGVIGLVMVILSGILTSSSHLQSRTARRAAVQADSRQTLDLMGNELRQAGADPSMPPVGITGIQSADSLSVRIQADLNGDGVIQTAEPSEDVTYAYDAGQKAITRNPGAGAAVVMDHVTAMSFSYYDSSNNLLGPYPLSAANCALVHSIGVTITCEDKDSHPLTLTTRIGLRNM